MRTRKTQRTQRRAGHETHEGADDDDAGTVGRPVYETGAKLAEEFAGAPVAVDLGQTPTSGQAVVRSPVEPIEPAADDAEPDQLDHLLELAEHVTTKLTAEDNAYLRIRADVPAWPANARRPGALFSESHNVLDIIVHLPRLRMREYLAWIDGELLQAGLDAGQWGRLVREGLVPREPKPVEPTINVAPGELDEFWEGMPLAVLSERACWSECAARMPAEPLVPSDFEVDSECDERTLPHWWGENLVALGEYAGQTHSGFAPAGFVRVRVEVPGWRRWYPLTPLFSVSRPALDVVVRTPPGRAHEYLIWLDNRIMASMGCEQWVPGRDGWHVAKPAREGAA